ncbi:hypothetical protein GCM10007857_76880 [Bradyrhizobium iriomotense]|uniref:DUF222 domain-containing protein n=1 Tax=Bradyrhizobium iriomotense TaxID=441950 RepID=A0ABQ6B9C2_9BRAD|nr:hypothetical protein GCM10007857_76880 [Bradyrhizobium iriomotense]
MQAEAIEDARITPSHEMGRLSLVDWAAQMPLKLALAQGVPEALELLDDVRGKSEQSRNRICRDQCEEAARQVHMDLGPRGRFVRGIVAFSQLDLSQPTCQSR